MEPSRILLVGNTGGLFQFTVSKYRSENFCRRWFVTRWKTNLALEEKTMVVLLTRFSRNSPGLRYRDRRRHDEEDEADPVRHPREPNRIGTNLEQTRDLQQRWSGFRWNTTSWQALCTCLVDGGLAGSRTFCTMLAILESAIAFIPRAMITRGMGWANDDAGHGMDRSDPCTRTGIRDPLQPPPSIVRWLPRTQQDRRNANVRIVQRYVIVIRDRFRTWIERINCDLCRSLLEFVWSSYTTVTAVDKRYVGKLCDSLAAKWNDRGCISHDRWKYR